MAMKQINLQDSFLNQVRKENVPVTVHLVNGFQIKGNVRGFDNFTVIIDSMGKQQMIYKHAISTVTPARPISGSFTGEKEKGEKAEKAEQPKEA
ncbi:MAG: RNA chaperone Hfq [Selenomonas sp.]|uniref:RNA chaperone Hfq n=1 Tax=Selenomonas sp. TaxID=2053611 RepID=UPI0025F712A6|nr:RNA chaperone Hfq [Selenomonas sp.]MCI6100772.1 RNA chaperone Hfq [Selenomonas sp.]MCI6233384.1 RNA chaperone Hfq [Selenomonas sp.]